MFSKVWIKTHHPDKSERKNSLKQTEYNNYK